MAIYKVLFGDLLKQEVDAIVNLWNRNFIPYWLLPMQGVSKAIKKSAGSEPFKELYKKGILTLGGAVYTSSGKLKIKGIIHVAGINALWRSNEYSIRKSVQSSLELSKKHKLQKIAIPLIGAGVGRKNPIVIENWIKDELNMDSSDIEVIIIKYT